MGIIAVPYTPLPPHLSRMAQGTFFTSWLLWQQMTFVSSLLFASPLPGKWYLVLLHRLVYCFTAQTVTSAGFPSKGQLGPTCTITFFSSPITHDASLQYPFFPSRRDRVVRVTKARLSGPLDAEIHNLVKLLIRVATNICAQVLAMGIILVFLTGLIKLWTSNRYMRKVEQLDAEKLARITEMQASGISTTPSRTRLGAEIPFGVKALQHGVEVDGIWVAKQAALAAQPPNRKWSSRRKSTTPNSLFEMMDITSPSRSRRGRTVSRASRLAAGKISRKEIVDPSPQTREKLENMSLLEQVDRREAATGGEHASFAGQDQKGALDRIQRSLRMKVEAQQEQTKRRHAGRVDAVEFRSNVQTNRPQRFYPSIEANSSATTPLMASKARSHATETRIDGLLVAHGASQAPARLAMRGPPHHGRPREQRSAESHSQGAPTIPHHSNPAHKAQIHQSGRRGSYHSHVPSPRTGAAAQALG